MKKSELIDRLAAMAQISKAQAGQNLARPQANRGTRNRQWPRL